MSLLRRGLGRVMGGRNRGNFTGSLASTAISKAGSAISSAIKTHGKNKVQYNDESSLGTQSKSKYSTGEYYD